MPISYDLIRKVSLQIFGISSLKSNPFKAPRPGSQDATPRVKMENGPFSGQSTMTESLAVSVTGNFAVVRLIWRCRAG
jgi:hypothetical protein